MIYLTRKRLRNYYKFDFGTKKLWQALAESLATSLLKCLNSNGDKLRGDFDKIWVIKAVSTTVGLNIIYHDINNACPRRRVQSSKVTTPSPAILPAAGGNILIVFAIFCFAAVLAALVAPQTPTPPLVPPTPSCMAAPSPPPFPLAQATAPPPPPDASVPPSTEAAAPPATAALRNIYKDGCLKGATIMIEM